MSDTRKEYVPPTAEVILLAPDENLAAWDWGFQSPWKQGYLPATEEVASAVGVINGGLTTSAWGDDGFTIVKKKETT